MQKDSKFVPGKSLFVLVARDPTSNLITAYATNDLRIHNIGIKYWGLDIFF